MPSLLRCALATAAILMVGAHSAGFAAGDKDERINPLYRDWANFPVGTDLIVHETTVFGDDGRTEEKTVEYRLVEVTDELAIVRTVVVEKDLFVEIQSAPTRMIYRAKISKAALAALQEEQNAKKGTENMKFLGKDLEVKTLDLTKKHNNEVVKTKIWRSTTVPGGVVKQIRTTEQDGKLVATTTVLVTGVKVAEKKDKKSQ